MSSFLQHLKQRGCIHSVSDFAGLEALFEQGSVTFYCGFDPTADSLHVGSMLPLMLIRKLQAAGHQPLVLIGSATGMIGDPSGKSEERKQLNEETLLSNIAGIRKQLETLLSCRGDRPCIIVQNHEWLKDLSFVDFLREFGKLFSVNAMIAKDSVRTRLENREQGISYTEFSYMLLQAYDFYWLYRTRGCRLQVGGSDQWGNITAGLDLIRRKTGEASAPVYGMTFPLIVTAAGSKFGKTEKGAVWLDPRRTSPFDFYQFWLNTADADVLHYLSLFTDLEDEELSDLKGCLKTEPENRRPQRRLAAILTEVVHGREERERAERAAEVLYSKTCRAVDANTLLEVHRDLSSISVHRADLASGITAQDLLAKTSLATSRSDARRLIEGGGVYLNDTRVNAPAQIITVDDFVEERVLVLGSGKKKKQLVLLEP